MQGDVFVKGKDKKYLMAVLLSAKKRSPYHCEIIQISGTYGYIVVAG